MVAPQVVEIDVDHARRVGSVHGDQQAVAVGHLREFLHRRQKPRDVGDVTHHDDPGFRGDGLFIEVHDLVDGLGEDGDLDLMDL